MFGVGEGMRGFFSGAQGLTGNRPGKFHSPTPFQLLLTFSVGMYHSPACYSRVWETSKGVGTTNEGTGTVQGYFFPKINFGNQTVIMITRQN